MEGHPFINEDESDVQAIADTMSSLAGEMMVFAGTRQTPMALVISGSAERDPQRDARMLCMALDTCLPPDTMEILVMGLNQMLESKRQIEAAQRQAQAERYLAAQRAELERAQAYVSENPTGGQAPAPRRRRLIREDE